MWLAVGGTLSPLPTTQQMWQGPLGAHVSLGVAVRVVLISVHDTHYSHDGCCI